MAHDFRKLEDEVLTEAVHHDEDVIDRKRTDMNEHEMELGKDHSKLLKDIREEEIKHDEKEIARKEKDAARHEAKIKENEQIINE